MVGFVREFSNNEHRALSLMTVSVIHVTSTPSDRVEATRA